MDRRLVLLLPCLLLVAACVAPARSCPVTEETPPDAPEVAEPVLPKRPRVLFVTQSVGYTHAVVKRSADGGLSLAETELIAATKDRWDVETTQDCATFDWSTLSSYDAVVFYTTGELPIPPEGRRLLLNYVSLGGGFVGIHPATDTLYSWPAYGRMIGGYFDGHPWHQKVRVKVENRDHPATKHLGESFEITDEIYQFKAWDRKKLQVLLSIDNASIDTKKKGVKREDSDFAVAWCKPYWDGRVFYTSLGHRPDVWKDERYLKHVTEGIAWTMERHRPDATVIETHVPPLLSSEHRDGWKQAGPGRFVIDEDGVATAEGGMGLLWYEPEAYRDFTLRLEFRQQKLSSNSGVFVRFPRVNGDPWKAVHEGYEVQIHGDKPSKHATGAIYSFRAPSHIPLKPPGAWNDMEIQCSAQRYTVTLNGEEITSFEGDRSLVGHIGLQNHGHADDAVSFRNIRIRRTPAVRVLLDILPFSPQPPPPR